jgi:FkbM family methyltransferase
VTSRMGLTNVVATIGNSLPARIGLPLRARIGPRLEPELGLVAQFVRPSSVVVDVGANRGVYTYFMSRAVGQGGRVLAYEPQPDLAAYVQAGMARAHNVTVRPVALGERLGTAELTIPSRDGRPEQGWATLRANVGPGRKAVVDVTTLDDELSDDDVSFIKIDVEGFELQVIQGARQLLRRTRPVVLLEIEYLWCGNSAAGTLGVFEDLGYSVWAVDAQRANSIVQIPWRRLEPVASMNEVIAGQRTYNFLFRPEESL